MNDLLEENKKQLKYSNDELEKAKNELAKKETIINTLSSKMNENVFSRSYVPPRNTSYFQSYQNVNGMERTKLNQNVSRRVEFIPPNKKLDL